MLTVQEELSTLDEEEKVEKTMLAVDRKRMEEINILRSYFNRTSFWMTNKCLKIGIAAVCEKYKININKEQEFKKGLFDINDIKQLIKCIEQLDPNTKFFIINSHIVAAKRTTDKSLPKHREKIENVANSYKDASNKNTK